MSPNGALPASVKLSAGMGLTPNEMRALKAETGRPLGDLLGGDPNDMEAAPERVQSLVWVALRRAGITCTWDEAGDVAPDFQEEPAPDPTNAGPSTSSSLSAASGV